MWQLSLWRRLRALDTAAAFLRHVNRPQCASFLVEVADELKAWTKPNTNLDTVLRAPGPPVCTSPSAVHAAPLPVNEYVASVHVTEFVTLPAATHAATASLSPVIEYVETAPVIEYIAPAPPVTISTPQSAVSSRIHHGCRHYWCQP